jgi:hypothetical protein
MLWTEGVLVQDGILYMVCCILCSHVDGRGRLMALKWNILCKHESLRQAKMDMPLKSLKKGDEYVVKNCRHGSYLVIYNTNLRKHVTILQRKKKVQFTTLFHTLAIGRPMLQYESLEELFEFVKVPNFPKMH